MNLGLAPRALVLLAFAVVLGVPWFFRPESADPPSDAEQLVIITPHNEPIRYEFGVAFDRWHLARHGRRVVIDWRVPGGTTEIRRLLIAQYTAAVEERRITHAGDLAPGADPMPYDLLFGGGTFEHTEMKTKGPAVTTPGSAKPILIPISVPAGFSKEQLDAWFGPGEPLIGIAPLYDPEQYWIGVAVSGFGIVYNRDVLRELNVPEPKVWTDLAHPALNGWVALADPRQSGSVATTYESALYSYGWERGWRLLREMTANARYFSNTSQKVPLDVSQGQAAVGTAIDFYGRFQSQSLLRPGEPPDASRVGYVDPPGEVMIDPDPISLLRAGPNPVVARRFLEFVLSEEGQAIWNCPKRDPAVSTRNSSPSESSREDPNLLLGPERHELRRLPIRRVMYSSHMDRLIDRVDPYALASKAKNQGWRSAIGLMMGAFSIDIHEEQRAAWTAIHSARSRGLHPAELLAKAEALFLAWPEHTLADGSRLPFTEANYKAIRADWRDAEKSGRMNRLRIEYTAYFREQYARVITLLADTSSSTHP